MKNRLMALLASLSITGASAGALAHKAHSHGEKPVTEVQMTVTSDGFQPAEVKTKAGKTLRLIITRKTDATCAKEVVIKDLGLKKPLPLNKAVAVEITPKKSGRLRYACAMDMIAGVLIVE